VLPHVVEPSQTEFRNFNVCPHCESNGQEAFLSRLTEGMPMISRSDGRNFHLLLADRPRPYPAERVAGPTRTISVCFWHMYGKGMNTPKSTVVIFESLAGPRETLYRQIEFIAGVLADELLRRRELAVFYNLQGNTILELSY
jgi:hypothetical protein